MTRRPTRRDLLIVISRLQDLIGKAAGCYDNDRDPQRADHVRAPLDEAFSLCIAGNEVRQPGESCTAWKSMDRRPAREGVNGMSAKLNPRSAALLKWVRARHPLGFTALMALPVDLPPGIDMSNVRGLQRRGWLRENSNHIFYLTDAGVAAADALTKAGTP